jgi:hypothetical protein
MKFQVSLINYEAIAQVLGREVASAARHVAIMDGDFKSWGLLAKLGTTVPAWHQTYDLEASSLGEVFEILNIAHPADYKLRSLSVGDIVFNIDTAEEFLVAPVGFKKI